MAKKRKLLVETSCVPVALGESSVAHRAEFDKGVADGELWASVYVRKEFVRRWICGYISFAFAVEHFGSVAEAIGSLEESFRIREIKIGLHAIAALLAEKGVVMNGKAAAKEVGRLAVRKLKGFDRQFPRRIQNISHCQIGGKELLVDHNDFFDCLRKFTEAIDDVEDCPVNEFLNLGGVHGRGQVLLNHAAAAKTRAGMKLAEFARDRATINCAKCAKIGDAVIALEQPRGWHIVHIDSDFGPLCEATGRQNIPIKSRRAADRDAGHLPPPA